MRKDNILVLGHFQLDFNKQALTHKHVRIELTDNEWLVLASLGNTVDKVVSIEALKLAVWNTNHKTDGMVRQLIKSIRDKVAKYDNTEFIETVQGAGYVLLSKPALASKITLSRKLRLFSAAIVTTCVLIVIPMLFFPVPDNSALVPKQISTLAIPSVGALRVHVSPNEKYTLIEYENYGKANNTIVLYDEASNREIRRFEGARPTWSPNNRHFTFALRHHDTDGSEQPFTHCDLVKSHVDLQIKSPPLRISCDHAQHAPNKYPIPIKHFFYEDADLGYIFIYRGDWKSTTDIHRKDSTKTSDIIQQDINLFFRYVFPIAKSRHYISINSTGIVNLHNADTGEHQLIGQIPGENTVMVTIGNHLIYKNQRNGLNQLDVVSGVDSELLAPQPAPISELTSNGKSLYVTLGDPSSLRIFEMDQDFKPIGQPIADEVAYLRTDGKLLYFLARHNATWRVFKHQNNKSYELHDTKLSTVPLSMDINSQGEFVILDFDKLIFKDKELDVKDIYESVHYIDDQTITYDLFNFSIRSGEVYIHDLKTNERRNIVKYRSAADSDKIRSSSNRITPIPFKEGVLLGNASEPKLHFQPYDGMMTTLNNELPVQLHVNALVRDGDTLYLTDRTTRQVIEYDLAKDTIEYHGQLIGMYFTRVGETFYGLFPTSKATEILKIDF